MDRRFTCALCAAYSFALLTTAISADEPTRVGDPPIVEWADEAPIFSRLPAPDTEEVFDTADGDYFAATNAAELAEGSEADLCQCEACQAERAAAATQKQAALKKAVATAYAPVFYNNKFDYLCDPAYDDWHLGERLKRMCVGNCSVLDLGGQYRARLHNERNMRGLGLTGVDDDFLLHRTRLFANLEVGERLRFFAEYIDAEENYENNPPRAIEVNRSDMLNLFVDARVAELCEGDLWLRVGRQELLEGAQRLISPLDWANTRRTFDGVNLFYKAQDWNIKGFLTRPVIVNPVEFDSPDDEQGFSGLYSTYTGRENETFDAYYIYSYNENPPGIAGVDGIHFHTAGGRWLGSRDKFLWEFEGAYQFGENDDGSDHSAAFTLFGVGRKFDHCWNPVLWAYYDWSTGGDALGQRQGFDHLFPLSHKYHGFMDFYARSNIETPNLLLEFQPREKIKMLLWYHYFMLQNKVDTPYNVNMTAFNPGNAPASADLGHEVDLTVQYLISARMDLLFGYSHFFAGRYYELTPGVPYRSDADFFYTQFTVNF